jgi:putative ubiquitin-RnfH superfamily antitoxin RatB of RatAB toxin-antitoxin module
VLGVWGRKTRMGHTLRDGDRVEIYRPLGGPQSGPAERFNQQGAEPRACLPAAAPGAKAGY